MVEQVDAVSPPPAKKAKVETSVEAQLKAMKQVVAVMDLTSLGDKDDEDAILKLIDQGKNNAPLSTLPAAFCIWSKFVAFAKQQKISPKVATVVNFPHGKSSLEEVRAEITATLDEADEVDLVIPYQEYLQEGNAVGETASVKMVRMAKTLCGAKNIPLKVIMETGEFVGKPKLIEKMSRDVVAAGADFIKTSTGKVKVGATLEAAEVMLKVIKEDLEKKQSSTQEVVVPCGFKASGGIRNFEDASAYVKLASDILGPDYVKPSTFRFGVSGLMGNLVTKAKELLGEVEKKSGEKNAESNY